MVAQGHGVIPSVCRQIEADRASVGHRGAPEPETPGNPPPWRIDPDYLKVREVIAGEIMMSPRPAPPHALLASSLCGFLMGPYHHGDGGGPGGW